MKRVAAGANLSRTLPKFQLLPKKIAQTPLWLQPPTPARRPMEISPSSRDTGGSEIRAQSDVSINTFFSVLSPSPVKIGVLLDAFDKRENMRQSEFIENDVNGTN